MEKTEADAIISIADDADRQQQQQPSTTVPSSNPQTNGDNTSGTALPTVNDDVQFQKMSEGDQQRYIAQINNDFIQHERQRGAHIKNVFDEAAARAMDDDEGVIGRESDDDYMEDLAEEEKQLGHGWQKAYLKPLTMGERTAQAVQKSINVLDKVASTDTVIESIAEDMKDVDEEEEKEGDTAVPKLIPTKAVPPELWDAKKEEEYRKKWRLQAKRLGLTREELDDVQQAAWESYMPDKEIYQMIQMDKGEGLVFLENFDDVIMRRTREAIYDDEREHIGRQIVIDKIAQAHAKARREKRDFDENAYVPDEIIEDAEKYIRKYLGKVRPVEEQKAFEEMLQAKKVSRLEEAQLASALYESYFADEDKNRLDLTDGLGKIREMNSRTKRNTGVPGKRTYADRREAEKADMSLEAVKPATIPAEEKSLLLAIADKTQQLATTGNKLTSDSSITVPTMFGQPVREQITARKRGPEQFDEMIKLGGGDALRMYRQIMREFDHDPTDDEREKLPYVVAAKSFLTRAFDTMMGNVSELAKAKSTKNKKLEERILGDIKQDEQTMQTIVELGTKKFGLTLEDWHLSQEEDHIIRGDAKTTLARVNAALKFIPQWKQQQEEAKKLDEQILREIDATENNEEEEKQEDLTLAARSRRRTKQRDKLEEEEKTQLVKRIGDVPNTITKMITREKAAVVKSSEEAKVSKKREEEKKELQNDLQQLKDEMSFDTSVDLSKFKAVVPLMKMRAKKERDLVEQRQSQQQQQQQQPQQQQQQQTDEETAKQEYEKTKRQAEEVLMKTAQQTVEAAASGQSMISLASEGVASQRTSAATQHFARLIPRKNGEEKQKRIDTAPTVSNGASLLSKAASLVENTEQAAAAAAGTEQIDTRSEEAKRREEEEREVRKMAELTTKFSTAAATYQWQLAQQQQQKTIPQTQTAMPVHLFAQLTKEAATDANKIQSEFATRMAAHVNSNGHLPPPPVYHGTSNNQQQQTPLITEEDRADLMTMLMGASTTIQKTLAAQGAQLETNIEMLDQAETKEESKVINSGDDAKEEEKKEDAVVALEGKNAEQKMNALKSTEKHVEARRDEEEKKERKSDREFADFVAHHNDLVRTIIPETDAANRDKYLLKEDDLRTLTDDSYKTVRTSIEDFGKFYKPVETALSLDALDTLEKKVLGTETQIKTQVDTLQKSYIRINEALARIDPTVRFDSTQRAKVLALATDLKTVHNEAETRYNKILEENKTYTSDLADLELAAKGIETMGPKVVDYKQKYETMMKDLDDDYKRLTAFHYERKVDPTTNAEEPWGQYALRLKNEAIALEQQNRQLEADSVAVRNVSGTLVSQGTALAKRREELDDHLRKAKELLTKALPIKKDLLEFYEGHDAAARFATSIPYWQSEINKISTLEDLRTEEQYLHNFNKDVERAVGDANTKLVDLRTQFDQVTTSTSDFKEKTKALKTLITTMEVQQIKMEAAKATYKSVEDVLKEKELAQSALAADNTALAAQYLHRDEDEIKKERELMKNVRDYALANWDAINQDEQGKLSAILQFSPEELETRQSSPDNAFVKRLRDTYAKDLVLSTRINVKQDNPVLVDLATNLRANGEAAMGQYLENILLYTEKAKKVHQVQQEIASGGVLDPTQQDHLNKLQLELRALSQGIGITEMALGGLGEGLRKLNNVDYQAELQAIVLGDREKMLKTFNDSGQRSLLRDQFADILAQQQQIASYLSSGRVDPATMTTHSIQQQLRTTNAALDNIIKAQEKFSTNEQRNKWLEELSTGARDAAASFVEELFHDNEENPEVLRRLTDAFLVNYPNNRAMLDLTGIANFYITALAEGIASGKLQPFDPSAAVGSTRTLQNKVMQDLQDILATNGLTEVVNPEQIRQRANVVFNNLDTQLGGGITQSVIRNSDVGHYFGGELEALIQTLTDQDRRSLIFGPRPGNSAINRQLFQTEVLPAVARQYINDHGEQARRIANTYQDTYDALFENALDDQRANERARRQQHQEEEETKIAADGRVVQPPPPQSTTGEMIRARGGTGAVQQQSELQQLREQHAHLETGNRYPSTNALQNAARVVISDPQQSVRLIDQFATVGRSRETPDQRRAKERTSVKSRFADNHIPFIGSRNIISHAANNSGMPTQAALYTGNTAQQNLANFNEQLRSLNTTKLATAKAEVQAQVQLQRAQHDKAQQELRDEEARLRNLDTVKQERSSTLTYLRDELLPTFAGYRGEYRNAQLADLRYLDQPTTPEQTRARIDLAMQTVKYGPEMIAMLAAIQQGYIDKNEMVPLKQINLDKTLQVTLLHEQDFLHNLYEEQKSQVLRERFPLNMRLASTTVETLKELLHGEGQAIAQTRGLEALKGLDETATAHNDVLAEANEEFLLKAEQAVTDRIKTQEEVDKRQKAIDALDQHKNGEMMRVLEKVIAGNGSTENQRLATYMQRNTGTVALPGKTTGGSGAQDQQQRAVLVNDETGESVQGTSRGQVPRKFQDAAYQLSLITQEDVDFLRHIFYDAARRKVRYREVSNNGQVVSRELTKDEAIRAAHILIAVMLAIYSYYMKKIPEDKLKVTQRRLDEKYLTPETRGNPAVLDKLQRKLMENIFRLAEYVRRKTQQRTITSAANADGDGEHQGATSVANKTNNNMEMDLD